MKPVRLLSAALLVFSFSLGLFALQREYQGYGRQYYSP
jgi:hypothetical protein